MFYSFLIHCIHEYFLNGLTYNEPKNIKSNRLKQVTSDEFSEWISVQKISIGEQYETKKSYTDFTQIYYPDNGNDEKFSQRKFTSWMKKYAGINDWQFKVSASNGTSYFQFLINEPEL